MTDFMPRPILAGKVHAVDDDHKVALQDSVHQDSINSPKQAGRVEARVTLAQVNDFKPTIKVLSFEEFPDTYEELNDEKMPANAFINDELTPLPDSVCHFLFVHPRCLQAVCAVMTGVVSAVAVRVHEKAWRSNADKIIAG